MTPIEGTQAILIVDDSDDDYDATVRVLKKGSNLRNPRRRCEDGGETLDYPFRKGSHSSSADAPRPSVDGRDVLKKIKSEPSLRSIPVIVMTNSDDEHDIEACNEMGANTYIQKPLNWPSFPEAMNRLKEYWFEIAVLARTET